MRVRFPLLVLASALCAAPARAAPRVDVRLPVIAADLQPDRVSIRLAGGLGSRGPAAAARSVTIEAYDENGKRLAETSITTSRRLTYALAPLPPAMRAASRLVVTAR